MSRRNTKSLLLLLLLLIHLHPVFAQREPSYVDIRIKGASENQAMLGRLKGSQIIPVDTLKGSEGHFRFRINNPVRGIYRFQLNDSTWIDLISAPDSMIVLQCEVADIMGSVKVYKSHDNQLYYSYLQSRYSGDARLKQLAALGNQALKVSAGKPTPYVDSLKNEYVNLLKQQKEYTNALIRNNQGSLAASLIQAQQVPDYQAYVDTAAAPLTQKEFYRLHFFDNINFRDTGLINTEVYYIGINDYLASFAKPPSTLTYLDACKGILDIAGPYPAFYDYALNLLISNFEFTIWEKVFAGLVEEYYLNYDRRNPALAKSYQERAKAIHSLEVGLPLPPLMQPDINGRPVSLSQLPGQVKIVVFWSAECEHCEEIMPDLLRIYSKYKSRGLEVMAVSMDIDRNVWIEGITKNKTQAWYHISDLKGLGGSVAKTFNIWMTPIIYVVDAENKILLRPYSVAALEKFIETETIFSAP